MSVPLTLLGLLHREPSHGYDLKRDYDAYFGRERPLPFGQVYATLARLARDGKVVPGETRGGPGPDRKRYVITDVGKRRSSRGWTSQSEPDPHLQTLLFVKVVLALMLERSAESYLDAQRAAHLRATAGTDRAQTHGRPGGCAPGRSRPVPSGGRPSVDRHHRGPAPGTCRGRPGMT